MAFTRRRWLKLGMLVLLAVVLIDAAVLAIKWPFTRSAVLKALREQAKGEVTVRGFEQTFFPQPGCIAYGLQIQLHPGSGTPPIVSAGRVVIRGDYTALLTFSKHLNEVDTEDMRIRIPRDDGEGAGSSSEGAVSVDRLVAKRTVLEFAPGKPGGEPFILQIHGLLLSPASLSRAIHFEAALSIPEPPGEISAQGSFGPWQMGGFQTPVSGTYRFTKANLEKFKGMAGILSSTGTFEGPIANIAVSGSTDVPDFEITDTSHRLHLETAFRAKVDGHNGDVHLDSVTSRFLHTEVDTEGAIASPVPGEAKTAFLNMSVNGGRIEDLLRLVSSGPPGLNGVTNLHFKVELPAGDKRLLERLRLTGQMGVGGATFTTAATQQGLEHISANASQGVEDPADVVSNLRGRITVADGIARLSALTFSVPGASAAMNGTYNLITHQVDLRGTIVLQEKVSQTTTGVKSFLLKALDPLFRKSRHLSVVPIRITGSKGNTSVRLDGL